MNVNYRRATEDDLPFIMSTWLKGQRHQGDRSFMTNRTYFDNEKNRITAILAKNPVIVVCAQDDATHVFGYLVYNLISDLLIVHYAHLKRAYRRLGIMRSILKEIYPNFTKDEVAITHINGLTSSLRDKYKLKFNPYLGGYQL